MAFIRTGLNKRVGEKVGEGSRNGVDIKLPHVGWSRVSKSGAGADNDVDSLNLDGMPFILFTHSDSEDNRDHFLALRYSSWKSWQR